MDAADAIASASSAAAGSRHQVVPCRASSASTSWPARSATSSRRTDANGDPDLSRAYYAGLLGTVTGVEVAEEAYLIEVIEPFESARSVVATLVSGVLTETLETRHGAHWWREAPARALVDDIAARPTAADALARLGYDGFDWRPVLRQIRTRLIGEMSGYGGPNITTRAGTRKV